MLGGTVFLGRNVVEVARERGDEVTVFNRGRSGAPPAGVELVRGDRTDGGDLEQLRGRHFEPCRRHLRIRAGRRHPLGRRARRLVRHYAFVSSINAFPGWPDDDNYHNPRPRGSGDPDASRDDLPADFDHRKSYGWLKVGCELAVRRTFGEERTSVLRAGVIVRPYDAVIGRLPWWLDRLARGGAVLGPRKAGRSARTDRRV